VAFIYSTGWSIYKLTNPLYGIVVEPGTKTVQNLWKTNQSFSLFCFLSSNPKFKPFNFNDLLDSNTLLVQKRDLFFNSENNALEVFNINFTIEFYQPKIISYLTESF
jgi:hypothetical protein